MREVRSKQSKEIRRLDAELQWTQEQLIANHRYVYELRTALADQGIDAPTPPTPSPLPASSKVEGETDESP